MEKLFVVGIGILLGILVILLSSFVAGGLLIIGMGFIDGHILKLLPEGLAHMSWGNAAAICFCSGLLFKGSSIVKVT